jgi:membrane-associated phospholipid phosphatase
VVNHRLSFAAGASLLLAGLVSAPSWGAAAPRDGAQVGQWKTWVLSSRSEIPVPAPPADRSDQTKQELEELRQLQKERSAITNTAIQYYNAVPATQRWHDQLMALMARDKVNPNRQFRALGILHTALHDAVVATFAAKYTHNRKPPSQVATDLAPVVTIASEPPAPEPSYPSEHAAIAGAAAGVVAAMFPNDASALQAMAQEAGQTRLLMGANYRSDVEAGLALGLAVARKANVRAAADGADAVWSGSVPIGPGLWTGANPLEPVQGTWKPWLMISGSQFRPGPPPALGSPEMNEELALIKRITSGPTPSQRAIAVEFAATHLPRFWTMLYESIRRGRLTVPQETRVTGTVSALGADSVIAGHDAKYVYWRLRPSMADPTIVPLVPVPNLPSYPSNAAIIYSAFGDYLSAALPQDAARFRYYGEEGGISRIYAGIHYPSDEQAGSQMGKSLAALAMQRDQLNEQ